MLSFNPIKCPSLIPSEYDSVIPMMYLTISSELDYIRPSIVPSMVTSVIPSIDYKNTASDESSLKPSSYPVLEKLVRPSIAI